MKVARLDVLKAWVAYYLLKCVIVIAATQVMERLGFLTGPDEKSSSLQEVAWPALAVYYTVLAVIATLLFKWAVSWLVVSRIDQEMSVDLSPFRYAGVWLIYATTTFTLGHLLAFLFEFTTPETAFGSSAEPSWLHWLVRPMIFTAVSLPVFYWAVTKLLLADRHAK